MGRDDYGLEASQRTDTARLTIGMVCCQRPLCLRAEVIALPDGRLALDAESLRRAVEIHVTRCGGR